MGYFRESYLKDRKEEQYSAHHQLVFILPATVHLSNRDLGSPHVDYTRVENRPREYWISQIHAFHQDNNITAHCADILLQENQSD